MKRASLTVLAIGLLCGQPSLGQTPDPWAPVAHSLSDKVKSAEITATPFDKFLKYKRYRVAMQGGQVYEGGFVHGPGHHVSAMAALVLDPADVPYIVFKSGDTRLSRAMHNQPYVSTSGIAGRWDKEGHSAGDIILGELAEEVGGEVVEGTFRRLGDQLSPTMPFESTECDDYFVAGVRITGEAYGDGGQMEAVGLIGPIFYSPKAANAAMDNRLIFDASRARAMARRAWDSIGYVPELGLYVQDHPKLLARFDTLGLGQPCELRGRTGAGPIPAPRVPRDSPASRITTAFVVKALKVPLGEGATMVDARIKHACYPADPFFFADQTLDNEYRAASTEWSSPPSPAMELIGPDFASQFLRLDYDRAKVAVYYLDPVMGPMVEMIAQVRPGLAFAPGSPAVVRRDIRDVVVPRSTRQGDRDRKDASTAPVGPGSRLWQETDGVLPPSAPGRLRVLAAPNAASSGQSDLFYHSVSCQLDQPPAEGKEDFLPLAGALSLCRQGDGDAETEATLLRLAEAVRWVPQLGMTVDEARLLQRASRKEDP